jgi:hypothetical protein
MYAHNSTKRVLSEISALSILSDSGNSVITKRKTHTSGSFLLVLKETVTDVFSLAISQNRICHCKAFKAEALLSNI